MPLRTLLILLFLAFGAVGAATAQGIGGAARNVHWTVSAEPADVVAGKETKLVFKATIDEGWKMYAMDSPPPSRGVKVEMDALPEGLTLAGDFRQSEPKEGFDPNFEKNVRYFMGSARLEVPVKVAAGVGPGVRKVSGKVLFMTCNEQMCLPPTRVPFETPVQVTAAPAPAVAAAETPKIEDQKVDTASTMVAVKPDSAAGAPVVDQSATAEITPSGGLGQAKAGGLLAFLLLAMGAGLAALLTPCVFPMIPLTVSFFTKHADSRGQSIRMASVYGAAIVLTFTSLGLLTALLVGAAGAQTIAANPYINLFIGTIFVVFALSLLGLFELRLPNGLLNYFNRAGRERGGYTGVIFMGLTLTLVSFSCTAPFVGALLAATAGGEWTYPILGMLAFSATFALPFFVFAMFPNALSSLPRSGAWMNAIKVVLGFVELAAAIKFLSNADLVFGWGIISRPIAIATVVVIFFLAGLYVIGKLRMKDEPQLEHIGVGRLLTAIFFFGASLYMLPGLIGAPLNKLDAYLPPRQATDFNLMMPAGPGHQGGFQEASWHTDDIEAAFAAAKQAGKPLFIDFSGYTCTNCREMESNVFTRVAVQQRFENDFVLLRLFTDDLSRGEEFQRFQLQLTGTVALPTYAVVDPNTRKVLSRHSGLATEEAFLAFLSQGAGQFKPAAMETASR